MENDKLSISNQNAPNFGKYFNATKFSDTKLKVLTEAGEMLGEIKAHKIILCQNEILEEILNTKKSATIVGEFDATQTFIQYLYTCKIEKSKLTPELLKIAIKFRDQFLQKACENVILKNLKSLSFSELIDEFLLALKNETHFISSYAAQHIAANYNIFKLQKEFSKITQDKKATAMVFYALDSTQKRKFLSLISFLVFCNDFFILIT